jgi:hypothetical protein
LGDHLTAFCSNPERIGRVEVFHAVVFDKDLRYAVIGCRQQEAAVKADFEWARLQVPIPVRPTPPVRSFSLTEAQVPLANDGSRVASIIEE